MEKVSFLEFSLLRSTRNLLFLFHEIVVLTSQNALEGLLNRVLGPPEMLSQDAGEGLENPGTLGITLGTPLPYALSYWRLDLFLGGCTDESYALGPLGVPGGQ